MYNTTTNGALQHETSGNKCLDLFSVIGNLRECSRTDILERFEQAFNENPELATQVAHWARAARQGSGERQTFYVILDEIAKSSPDFITDNANTLADIGYYKDLLRYFHLDGVVTAFAQSIKSKDRLACKWAPRKGENARKLRDELQFTNKEYRKWISEHSHTVEDKMSSKMFWDINYSSVPGGAMRKYKDAFMKRDLARFDDWKNDKTMTASVSATYPHQVIEVASGDEALADKMWNSLEDFVTEGENILPMIDTSGSMIGMPLQVAISLGMYLAEKNKSEFQDTFLTFSESPELVRLEGGTVAERMRNIEQANWGMNTDFTKAYDLILQSAITYDVDKDSMPTMLLVLSDMQFDESQDDWNNSVPKVHFDDIKDKFNKSGYEMPKLVFWNLNSYSGNQSTSNEDGVCMVSGFSPSIMKAILSCEDFNPMNVMMEALEPIELDYTNLNDELDINYQQEV
jgi:hypothetical protein